MADSRSSGRGALRIYLLAWLIYALFAFITFPVLNLTAMLFSIALTMLGAWLYGFPGCFLTTLLSIPFHSMILAYHTDAADPLLMAMHPIALSIQLIMAGAVALIRRTKRDIEALNRTLEQKVKARTDELERLRQLIVNNHELTQVILSHTILGDIGDALSGLLIQCEALEQRLRQAGDHAAPRVEKLTRLVQDSIGTVANLEFVDRFFANQETGYEEAVRDIARRLAETTGIRFELDFQADMEEIPRYLQHQLYRITQEAVTNAIRHGKPVAISIHLGQLENSYQLRVANEGQSLPSPIESGLGLRLMKDRAEQLGGSLSLGSNADGHTMLHCSIPKNFD